MSYNQNFQLTRYDYSWEERRPRYEERRPRYESYSLPYGSEIQFGGVYGGYPPPFWNFDRDAYNLTDIANQATYNESQANIDSSTASGSNGGNNKPYNFTKIAQGATYNKSTAHITSKTGC